MHTYTHCIIAEAKRLGLKRIRIEYSGRMPLLEAELHGRSVAVRLPRLRGASAQCRSNGPIAYLHRQLRRSIKIGNLALDQITPQPRSPMLEDHPEHRHRASSVAGQKPEARDDSSRYHRQFRQR